MTAMHRSRDSSILALFGLSLAACVDLGREADLPDEGALSPVAGDSLRATWEEGPALPFPIANNAVASLRVGDRLHLFSFLGIDSTRLQDGIVRDAFSLRAGEGWQALRPVPGAEGRLAATAQAVDGRVYLFGGYTVAPDGQERSVPEVDVWDPVAGRWEAASPIPLPVDDAVSGVWRDSLIYLVSGWSQSDNVADVQIFDPAGARWLRGTPIPGPPVFGHAGAIAEDAIIYCGGVRIDPSRNPRFVISDSCWRGEIEPNAPERIAWRELAPPPGRPKYRAAAGTLPGSGLVIFTGGTDNPYNFDGVGYDGVPSEPDPTTFAYDVRRDRWLRGPPLPAATMDHRGLVWAEGALWVVGGMRESRRVTGRTGRLRLGASVPGSLAGGRAAFEVRCAGCHGFEAGGTGHGPPLVHPVYRPSHHADAAFQLAVTSGVRAHHWTYGDMPPVRGVDRADVERIVAYVRWLQRRAGID